MTIRNTRRHYIVSTRSRHDSAKRKRKKNRHHVSIAAKRRQSWRHRT